MNHPHTYGFYQYKQLITTSKYEIMQLADNPQDVKWNYNDEFFSSFDWTTEPPFSLDELYTKRAEKLREQYDHIVLMYSGGSDSTNILETFARNNIPLDEVCFMVDLKGSQNPASFVNNEVFNVAIPKVQKLGIQTKQTLFDITDNLNNFYTKKNSDFIHWINDIGTPFTQARVRAGSIYENGTREWKELLTAGKKVCFVWGAEKPRVEGFGENFSFHFADCITLMSPTKNILESSLSGGVDELFYWSPTYEGAQIIIKQSHIIKNFFQRHVANKTISTLGKLYAGKDPYKHQLVSNYFSADGKLICALGGDMLKILLYPSLTSADLVSFNKFNSKPSGHFLNERDIWFYQQSRSDGSVDLLVGGLQHYISSIKAPWIKQTMQFHDKTLPNRITRVKSKLYII